MALVVLMIVFGVAILIGVWNAGSIARFAVPPPTLRPLASQLIFRGGTYIVLKRRFPTPPTLREFLMLTTGFVRFLRRQDAAHHHHAAGHLRPA